jgi:glycosyltransferase involved in cell wall biosynthesis
MICFTSAKIQVQIHGDIGNKTWIHLTTKNLIRSVIARFTLRLANQFRTVGGNQTSLLISKYRIPKTKCRVIPVSSLFSTNLDTTSVLRSALPVIGFVGRIHSDRGTEKFVELVAKLRRENILFSVIVAGDGPENKSFEIELEKLLPRENIILLGNLKQEEMVKAWSQIRILVSTAPTESFGRAIREAIAWGIPVWAIPSSGVSDLQREVSQLYVKDLTIEMPAEGQVEIYNELMLVEIPLEVRKRVIEADKKALDSLIESWIELCR